MSDESAPRVIKVIVVTKSAGTGTEDDPFRPVKQYWSFKGELLAEFDHFKECEGK